MKDCNDKTACFGRREFLVKAGLVAGGTVLTISALSSSSLAGIFADVTIQIGADSPLAKVGGSQTVDSSAGKIIVIRTGEAKFAALSAVCTHKGGPLKYDADKKLLACPWHGSKYNDDGTNAGGPSQTPLKTYVAKGSASSVTVEVGS